VDGDRVIYRILFAQEGGHGQILLAIHGFRKSTQKTPPATLQLARRRLTDWRRRGDESRVARGRPPLRP
jgi:phage-related protein